MNIVTTDAKQLNRSRCATRFLRSFLVLVGAMSVAVSPAPAVTFTPLGNLPSFRIGSGAAAISGDGKVVVGSSFSGDGAETFRWTQETGMVGLGDLPGGRFWSSATATSFDGNVIVGESEVENGTVGFIWTAEEGLVEFPIRPQDVSADGNVVVGESHGVAGRSDASRWTEELGVDVLELPPTGAWDSSEAKAVSADGRVIVGDVILVPAGFPIRWIDGAEGELHSIPVHASDFRTEDISADGKTVIGAVSPAVGPQLQAFRWTEEGGGSVVPNPPGVESLAAVATSADGAVMVGTEFRDFPDDPFSYIWDETNGWRRITQILIDSGVDVAGWESIIASDISGDGRFIVGGGTNPEGNSEAWFADLSNPTPFPGDYNANNIVDQADLDLVLLHWGSSDFHMFAPPDGWIRNLPTGLVDQAELDAVLLNWGNTQPLTGNAAAVPEPGAALLLSVLTALLFMLRSRSKVARRYGLW